MDRVRPLRESQPAAQAEPNWLDELIPAGSEMAKTAGLFLRGRTGMAITVASYAFGEVFNNCKDKKLEDWKAAEMSADVLLGSAKGALMKASFGGLTHLKAGIAKQGVILGQASRLIDTALSRSTFEPAGEGRDYLIKTGISQPLDKVLNTTFDPLSMVSDAVVFVAGHGMFKGLQKVNKGISEKPIVAIALTGGTFGMASGSAGEILRQKQNGEDLDVGKVFGLGLKHAALDAVAALPAGLQADKHMQEQAAELSRQMGKEVSNLSRQAAREIRWRYWQDIARIKPKEMGLIIPDEITSSKEWLAGMEAIRILKQAGYKAYFVGGCVRDLLLNKIPKDYDVVTNAPSLRVNELLPEGKFAGRNFAVKHANINGIEIEIATFRCDGAYSDGRHPDDVTPLDKLPVNIAMREDAGRRDFKINSMFLEPESRTIYYYFDGPADLMNKKIDSVGNPHDRFNEDPSRMLRVATFAGKLGFEPSERVVDAMIRDAHKVHRSAKRSWGMELGKLLMTPDPVKGLNLLKQTGLIREMTPELDRLDTPAGDQDPIHHPEGTTWTHTMMVVDRLAKSPKRNQNLMFSGLFHDIGKPDTQAKRADGRITNHKHESVGAELTKIIGRRLDLSGAQVEDIAGAVEKHMAMHGGPKMTDGTRHKYLELPNIENLIELQDADALGRGKCCSPEDVVDAHEQGNAGSQRQFWEGALEEARNPLEASRAIDAELILDGRQLINLGYKSGVPLGEIKEAAKFAQFQGKFTNLEGALKWLLENCESPQQANTRGETLIRQLREEKNRKRGK